MNVSSDTAYGWGVTVNLGFIELEAKNSDPVQPVSSPVLGVVLPATADTNVAHVGINCLYVGAYIFTSTTLSN